MTSHAAPGSPRKLLANPTTAARLTAFFPYHADGMADMITLADGLLRAVAGILDAEAARHERLPGKSGARLELDR
jgi:hypothetical protein